MTVQAKVNMILRKSNGITI